MGKLPPTDHLRPTAPIASRALLPGDPGRALALAQALLEQPRMANHARGLWGYTARTRAGMELTIQSTGIGGPSIAIVMEELARLGLERAIRIGTCRALEPSLEPGDLVVAAAAIPAGRGQPRATPDGPLATRLLASGEGVRQAVVASTDLYYEPDDRAQEAARLAAGAQVVDLGSAAALEAGQRLALAVASVLVVTRAPGCGPLDDEAVEEASIRLGRVASAALAG